MARSNVPFAHPPVRTHEGAPAARISPLKELRRTVLATMLFEPTFYEGKDAVPGRIDTLVPQLPPKDVAALAIEARDKMYLRHVPLYLVRALARTKGNGTLVADTLERVIQRPDELCEYIAMYWAGKASGTAKRPEPLSAGSKRGLARAFRKFNEYSLAKYDADRAVKLRDVLRLTHAKPSDPTQAALWKKAITRTLETPDTWETELSAGKDKRETFERLLRENKLGALAFLRNLRNMIEAGVDPALIRQRFTGKLDKVLPFRYVAAVRHAPAYAQELNDAMLRAVADEPKLLGRTAVVVDVSGSMDYALSPKSEMHRIDAAAGLAVLVREIAPDSRVFTFSDRLVEAPSYRGLPLVKGILDSQPHSSTMLGASLTQLAKHGPFDRVIVITDEQSHDVVGAPAGKGYLINVANYQHGVGYGNGWVHVDGWSERIVDFIRASEADDTPMPVEIPQPM